MSIRQNVFRIGETIEISLNFSTSDGQPILISQATVYVRKPDGTLSTNPVSVENGATQFDVEANMPGTWKIRIESGGNGARVVQEKRFEVAPSTVI